MHHRGSNPGPFAWKVRTLTVDRCCRDMCFPPDLGSPHTYPTRDICSPTQISLIIMQQWEVFPQGKMFPQIGYMYVLCMG